MNNLLIIGAGQYEMLVKELASSLGYEKIDFIDDNSGKAVGKQPISRSLKTSTRM